MDEKIRQLQGLINDEIAILELLIAENDPEQYGANIETLYESLAQKYQELENMKPVNTPSALMTPRHSSTPITDNSSTSQPVIDNSNTSQNWGWMPPERRTYYQDFNHMSCELKKEYENKPRLRYVKDMIWKMIARDIIDDIILDILKKNYPHEIDRRKFYVGKEIKTIQLHRSDPSSAASRNYFANDKGHVALIEKEWEFLTKHF